MSRAALPVTPDASIARALVSVPVPARSTETRRRGLPRRRALRALWAGALGAVLFIPLDALSTGQLDARIFALWTTWAAVLAVLAVWLRTQSGSGAEALQLASAVPGLLFFVQAVAIRPASPASFLWLAAYPLTMVPWSRRATIFAAVSGLFAAGGAALATRTGWAFPLGLLITGALAVRAAFSIHRLQRRDHTRRHHALETVQKLGVSERRRMQSERLALVGQLASGVAHEINNPLAVIRANMARIREEAHDEAAQLLDEALAGTERIASLVRDLRAFAREPQETGAGCRVHEAVADAVRLFQLRLKTPGVLEVDISNTLPAVTIAPRKLAQVVLNLLVNAQEALESLGPDARRRIRVSAGPSTLGVLVCIEDSGPGLSGPVLARLFEPFFTTKPQRGTGLGLALSREYVQQVGGALSAGSSELGGAAFRADLPRIA